MGVRLGDGGDGSLPPGEYHALDDGERVSFFRCPSDDLPCGCVPGTLFGAMLTWRKVVFLSW
jgi:hypothetical protein